MALMSAASIFLERLLARKVRSVGVRGYVPREAEFGSRNRVGGAQLRSELGLLNPQLGCGASELGPELGLARAECAAFTHALRTGKSRFKKFVSQRKIVPIFINSDLGSKSSSISNNIVVQPLVFFTFKSLKTHFI